jgi:hypothetical protein
MRIARFAALALCCAPAALAQNNNTSAALTGLGAGTALGGAVGGGAGATSPGSVAGAGGSGSAPIEIQIMAYAGLSKISAHIAQIAVQGLCAAPLECPNKTPLLLEDSTASTQIALYQATSVYLDEIRKLDQALSEHADLVSALSAGTAPAPGVVHAQSATAAAAAAAAAGAASGPQWITNFGGIGTALEGLKSGITYASSTAQPTTQAFQTLVENELRKKKIVPFTSTSPLNLAEAVTALTADFSAAQSAMGRINKWAAICKPPATGGPQPPAPCSDPTVQQQLTLAQQLITGYTNLIQAPNDGAGNPAMVDILRGRVLTQAIGAHIPSLQLSVLAAAGSTRTNAFFLLSIFYQPKPSYNGGVIASYELRAGDNTLIQSGAETAFYDYNKKWKGAAFDDSDIQAARDCVTQGAADPKCRALSETFSVERK